MYARADARMHACTRRHAFLWPWGRGKAGTNMIWLCGQPDSYFTLSVNNARNNALREKSCRHFPKVCAYIDWEIKQQKSGDGGALLVALLSTRQEQTLSEWRVIMGIVHH